MSNAAGPTPAIGELRSRDGELLGPTEVFADSPRPRLELRLLGATPFQLVAEALVGTHAGHRFSVNDPLFEAALLEVGARPIRRSCLMVLRPLRVAASGSAPGTRAPGTDLVAMDTEDPGHYAGALCRAFPPEHPDHDPDINDAASATDAIVRYVAGTIVGPFVAAASAEARSPSGEAVGAIVISDMPADDSFDGGPWVTELFVDPAHQGRGIGRALLAHAVGRLIDVGRGQLGLSVQLDNPAKRLYDEFGFITQSTWTTFVL